MTVCIAASFGCKGGKYPPPGIVIVTDRQITDDRTGLTSQVGRKIAVLDLRIAVLGADDMIKFDDLVIRARDKMDSVPVPERTPEKAVEWFLAAEADWRNSRIDRYVLAPYGLSLQTFYEKQAKGELMDVFASEVKQSIDAYKAEYSVDAIVAGMNDSYPMMWSVRPEGVDNHTSEGFAVIGSGRFIAESALRDSEYSRYEQFETVLMQCLIAKKRAEVDYAVGDETVIAIMSKEVAITPLSGNAFSRELEQECQKLDKRNKANEAKAIERARAIVEKYNRKGWEITRKNTSTTLRKA